MSETRSSPPSLIGADDPPPFRLYNGEAEAPVLLVCDHASNTIPRAMGTLGLDEACFNEHIAYDPGAAQVTRLLAKRMGAVALLAGYSRLLIDYNRPPGHPQSVPEASDGTPIPANRNLQESHVQQRQGELFWPYHNAISDQIAHLWRSGPPPALICLHSFAPSVRLCSKERPWHIGVMWNRDPRMAQPMIQNLRAQDPALVVGDNEPYSGKDIGFTADTHAGAAGLPHVSFEIRQDLLLEEAGIERWASLLHSSLSFVLSDASLHRVQHF